MTYTILDRHGNVFTIHADGQFEDFDDMIDALTTAVICRAIATEKAALQDGEN